MKMPSPKEMDQMARDENMRLLGARDGYIGALLKVRGQIANITHGQSIDPRHVRKLAAREKMLAPLRTLERLFDEQRAECQRVYRERSGERT